MPLFDSREDLERRIAASYKGGAKPHGERPTDKRLTQLLAELRDWTGEQPVIPPSAKRRKKKFSPPTEHGEITMLDKNGKRVGGIVLDAPPVRLKRGEYPG